MIVLDKSDYEDSRLQKHLEYCDANFKIPQNILDEVTKAAECDILALSGSKRYYRGLAKHHFIKAVRLCRHDPVSFIKIVYPWGEGDLARMAWPEKWQLDYLKELGEETKQNDFNPNNPRPVPPVLRVVSGGRGTGKTTAHVAFVLPWLLNTRPGSMGAVTANTDTQLRSTTWVEMGKWHNLSYLKDCWKYNLTRGSLYYEAADSTLYPMWGLQGIPTSAHLSTGLSGRHNQNASSIFFFDEASTIARELWITAKASLTEGEPFMFAVGNNTESVGMFSDCFKKDMGYKTRIVDVRDCVRVTKEYCDSFIKQYGEGSDEVRVNIEGKGPQASSYQFISDKYLYGYDNTLTGERFIGAYGRHLRVVDYQYAPVIIGVDPAGTGKDKLAIALRQGKMSKILFTQAKTDTDDRRRVAALIGELAAQYKADAIFIDSGGGGEAIYDSMHYLGISKQFRTETFKFGGGNKLYPHVSTGFRNIKAYMWQQMKEWIMEGGSISNTGESEGIDREITSALMKPDLINGQINLEPKRESGTPSPDRADALALTFAKEVLIGETEYDLKVNSTRDKIKHRRKKMMERLQF